MLRVRLSGSCVSTDVFPDMSTVVLTSAVTVEVGVFAVCSVAVASVVCGGATDAATVGTAGCGVAVGTVLFPVLLLCAATLSLLPQQLVQKNRTSIMTTVSAGGIGHAGKKWCNRFTE